VRLAEFDCCGVAISPVRAYDQVNTAAPRKFMKGTRVNFIKTGMFGDGGSLAG
jgi:hypothetical protein